MADEQSPLGGPLELPGGEAERSKPTRDHKPRRRPGKKTLLIIVGMLAIATLGLVGFNVLKRKSAPTAQPTVSSSSTTEASISKEKDVPDVTGTQTFTSSTLGVELTYPNAWKVTENSGGIRIGSPDFSFVSFDRGTVSGNFRLYIRKGARDVDSKYIGRGVAILDSQKITYSQPTSGQRKDTNLSFFGLDAPDHFAYLFVAGNFNLKKGDTLGPNYGKEPDTFIVTGGYSAQDLTDDFATYKMPLDAFQQTKAYKQAIDIIKSLKLN